MSRHEDLDRVVREAALHGAGGSARTAAARLRVQADHPPPDAQPGYAERRRRVADGLERLADDDPDARSRRYFEALAAGDVQMAYAVAREPLPSTWPADVRSVWGSRRDLTARLADRLMTASSPEPDTRSGTVPHREPEGPPGGELSEAAAEARIRDGSPLQPVQWWVSWQSGVSTPLPDLVATADEAMRVADRLADEMEERTGEVDRPLTVFL